ncbi:MAG TPA: inner membrane CreD family protein [Candidatus Angelobacter sp.]|nr:inner membrane CreD family protein [Candidatus Angelobacter sp.]
MSTVKRIFALVVIFVFATIAWAILGATIFERSYGLDDSLRSRVSSTWGTAQVQSPPSASYERVTPEKQDFLDATGAAHSKIVQIKTTEPLPLESTQINTALQLEHRQKGLLWFSTYKVVFDGEYGFLNNTGQDQDVTFNLPLPAEQAMYDNVVFKLDNAPVEFKNAGNTLQATRRLGAGKTAILKVGYASQGMDRWTYKFGDQVSHVRDFHLTMSTNFKDIDFPDNTLSPSDKRETGGGWQLDWNYKDLLSGYQIGMIMPEKLQPGPLAGRISLFAPVSLFFFFFLVFLITTIRRVDLHPMNYFFLAAAFFAFHLLMAYLVDHISIHWSFAISAIVSLALVISYMRLVTGPRFALVECGLAQLVYLVLFSYAFFFKGYTGLTVTIGSIVTLFVVMQMTGRINWSERFARAPAPPPPVPVR